MITCQNQLTVIKEMIKNIEFTEIRTQTQH